MTSTDASDPELLKRNLARLLWRSKLPNGLDAEQRKKSWADDRRDYIAQASKMLRLSDTEQLSISLAAAPANASASMVEGDDA